MTKISVKYRPPCTFPEIRAALGRVALVGEYNPLSNAPEHALYPHPPGCAGNRLMKLLGLSTPQYLSIHRVNLCVRAWDTREAKRRARLVLADPSAPWRAVVMLGTKVRAAFGSKVKAFYYEDARGTEEWIRGPVKLVALPHPSGRCRVWNDPARKTDVVDVMRAVVPEVPWGEFHHG